MKLKEEQRILCSEWIRIWMKLCGESDDLLDFQYIGPEFSHFFSLANEQFSILDSWPCKRVMFCVNKCGEIPKKFAGIRTENLALFIDVVDREHGRPETYDKLI